MVKIIDEHTVIETKSHGHDHSLLHRETRQKLVNPDMEIKLNGTDSDEIQLETYFILGKANSRLYFYLFIRTMRHWCCTLAADYHPNCSNVFGH